MLAVSACGSESRQDLKVYTGYADTGVVTDPAAQHQRPPEFPNPWQGSANVNFQGRAVEGGQFEAGAIRIENPNGEEVEVRDLRVSIGGQTYAPWGGEQTVPAHGSLILTQTKALKTKPLATDFDTSESSGTDCTPASTVPQVHLSVGGRAQTVSDSQRVLNTGGRDLADCAAGSPNESHQWFLAGTVAASEPAGAWDALGFGAAVAFGSTLLSFLPALVAGLLLLLLGWWLARRLGGVAAYIVDRLGLGPAAERVGAAAWLRRDPKARPTLAARGFGFLITAFVFLIFVEAAADALHLTALKSLLNGLVLFLPNLGAALLIVAIGLLLGDAARGFHPLARIAVIAFAVMVAVEQVGVASTLVDALFAAIVLAAALAVGIAFGFGGRRTAAEVLSRLFPGPGRLST